MKTKRKTYPGSIYSPKDSNTLYIKFKGKRYPTGLFDTKDGRKQAEIYLERLWLQFHSLDPVSISARKRVKEAFDMYMNAKAHLYPKTLQTYKYCYDCIITDNYYLNEDKIEADIQNYLKKSKHSDSSKNIVLNNFQPFLNFCTKKNFLKKTNFKADYKRKGVEIENQPFTDIELDKLYNYYREAAKKSDQTNLQQSYKELALLFEFAVETGSRKVDALNLKWSDIDFNKKQIAFKNKITKKPEIRPLSNTAIAILQRLPQNRDKVFTWEYSACSYINKKMREAFTALGIDSAGRSFQEFRLTYRMRLLNKGVPENYIVWMLRHSDSRITDVHYTHHDIDTIKSFLNAN